MGEERPIRQPGMIYLECTNSRFPFEDLPGVGKGEEGGFLPLTPCIELAGSKVVELGASSKDLVDFFNWVSAKKVAPVFITIEGGDNSRARIGWISRDFIEFFLSLPQDNFDEVMVRVVDRLSEGGFSRAELLVYQAWLHAKARERALERIK